MLDRDIGGARSRLRYRDDDFRDQLAGLEPGRERPEQKLVGVQGPFVRAAAETHARSERQGDGRHVGCRIGVGKAPADRPQVADLEVADSGRTLGERGELGPV